jgi:hypothetical protein
MSAQNDANVRTYVAFYQVVDNIRDFKYRSLGEAGRDRGVRTNKVVGEYAFTVKCGEISADVRVTREEVLTRSEVKPLDKADCLHAARELAKVKAHTDFRSRPAQ